MFPINLRLTSRKVLLVGAGKVGKRKLEKIIKAGAQVLVVEPNPDERLSTLAADGLIELKSDFDQNLLKGISLVFAASSDHALNKTVARVSNELGLWVNVADAPELSDFILPAVVEDGDFQLSISTGGASPALAASVAADLRENFGPTYGRLTWLSSILRPVILSADIEANEREIIFKRLINSLELRKCLAANDMISAVQQVKELIAPVELDDDFTLDGLL